MYLHLYCSAVTVRYASIMTLTNHHFHVWPVETEEITVVWVVFPYSRQLMFHGSVKAEQHLFSILVYDILQRSCEFFGVKIRYGWVLCLDHNIRKVEKDHAPECFTLYKRLQLPDPLGLDCKDMLRLGLS